MQPNNSQINDNQSSLSYNTGDEIVHLGGIKQSKCISSDLPQTCIVRVDHTWETPVCFSRLNVKLIKLLFRVPFVGNEGLHKKTRGAFYWRIFFKIVTDWRRQT